MERFHVAIQQGQRLLPGTACALPRLRRQAPVAGNLRSVGSRSSLGRFVQSAAAPEPEYKLALVPRADDTEWLANGRAGLGYTSRQIALQPSPLRARASYLFDTLQFT